MFGRGSAQLPTSKYQVTVRSQGQTSLVSVQDGSGAPAPAKDAQRIVQVLVDELK